MVVVAVVINGPLFPPPSKIETKKVNHNHQPQKRWLCKSTLSQTLKPVDPVQEESIDLAEEPVLCKSF